MIEDDGDDSELSVADRNAVAASRAHFRNGGEGTSFEQVAADCGFTPAPGVSFLVDSADRDTQSFYLVGGVPVSTAMATDTSALGGFLNLPQEIGRAI